MAWKKVKGYELEKQDSNNGKVKMLFEEGEPVTITLPAQDFSVWVDMLRNELPRVYYEDAHKILKASDKKPEDLQERGPANVPNFSKLKPIRKKRDPLP